MLTRYDKVQIFVLPLYHFLSFGVNFRLPLGFMDMKLMLGVNMKDITAHHETNYGNDKTNDCLDADGIFNRFMSATLQV